MIRAESRRTECGLSIVAVFFQKKCFFVIEMALEQGAIALQYDTVERVAAMFGIANVRQGECS